MWWCDAIIGRRRAVAAIAGCALTVLLAACGFQPLHGRQNDSAGADAAPMASLADIYIAPIPDRIGQEVRNGLLDRLNRLGQPAKPRFRLNVVLQSRKEGLAIRSDETVTRFNFRLGARFKLIDTQSGETLFSGRTVAISAYNIVRSSFANVTAEKDAQSRAAREVSEEIHAQITVYMKRREER